MAEVWDGHSHEQDTLTSAKATIHQLLADISGLYLTGPRCRQNNW